MCYSWWTIIRLPQYQCKWWIGGIHYSYKRTIWSPIHNVPHSLSFSIVILLCWFSFSHTQTYIHSYHSSWFFINHPFSMHEILTQTCTHIFSHQLETACDWYEGTEARANGDDQNFYSLSNTTMREWCRTTRANKHTRNMYRSRSVRCSLSF